MVEKRRLPKCICGFDEYEVTHRREWVDKEGKLSFSIIRCLNCNLCRTFPTPKRITPGAGGINYRLENLKLWRAFGQNLIQLIKKYKKSKKIKLLDIGSNIGIFVKLAKESGWTAIGIDLDKNAVDVGRQKFKIDLRWVRLEKAQFKSESFDVVVLSHTFEHIPQPKKLINEIRRILKKGGILIMEVPNIEGLPVKMQKIRGENWYGFDPRHHLWHFSPQTICQILEGEGFKVLELDTHRSLHYQKTGSLLDIPRDFILKIASFLGMADQITLVAAPEERLD